MKNHLTHIINKHGLNGFTVEGGTDKDTTHNYLDLYQILLSPYRHKECNVLEIGNAYGGSSVVWHDYLYKSHLHLLDVGEYMHPKAQGLLDQNRITRVIRDAYTHECVDDLRIVGGFDIIFEDGPHTFDSQKFCVEYYTQLLKPGGILIMEDIQDYNHFSMLESVLGDEFVSTRIDLRYHTDRYDDLVFLVNRL